MDIKPALTYLRQGGLAYLSLEELISLRDNTEAVIEEKTFYFTFMDISNIKGKHDILTECKNELSVREHLIYRLQNLPRGSKLQSLKRLCKKLLTKSDFLPQIYYCSKDYGFEKTINLQEFNQPPDSQVTYMVFSYRKEEKI